MFRLILVLPVTILFSCLNVGKDECEHYSLDINQNTRKFELIGDQGFVSIRYTDRIGNDFKIVKFDTLTKDYSFLNDFSEVQAKFNIDSIYFKVISSSNELAINRDYTGILLSSGLQGSRRVCPNRR